MPVRCPYLMPRLALPFLLLAPLLLGGCSGSLLTADAPVPAVQRGTASYYADAFHGRPTASGEPFDMYALTAAHRSLPFGTRVRVTNLDNDRSVVLRINDRGPFAAGRILDVSLKAAQTLGFVDAGLASVQIEVVGDGD